MNMQRPSCVVAVVLIATQVLGPAVLWAAEQRGIRVEASNRVVIAAISEEPLTAQTTSGSKSLRFRDTVEAGDQLATGDRTIAEVLIGNRAVLTLGRSTTAQLTTVTPEQTTIQVTKGIVRVAASADALGGQSTMTIQTPTGQVQTRGGIVRVMVDTPVGSAGQTPAGEAKPYLASYSPNPMLAAIDSRGDIIQVEEGTVEIAGAGPGGETLTVQAGQSVTVQAGQAGSISELVTPGEMRAGVLASADHANTSKEGLEHLIALQVDQAAALGRALTGETELGQGQDDSAEKDNVENAIIGPTGGVSLNNTIVNALFGGGNTSNPSTPNPTESTGGGFGGNNNSGFQLASSDNAGMKVNGGAYANREPIPLLIFTRKDPVQSFVKEDITIPPDDFGGERTYLGGSACNQECLGDHRNTNNFENVVFNPLSPVPSKFRVEKELVLVGGTPNTGHGGIAPTKTLIVRGAAPGVGVASFTNLASSNSSSVSDNFDGLYPTDRFPADIGLFSPTPSQIVSANSTFVIDSNLDSPSRAEGGAFVGGTLGQYSSLSTPSPNGIVISDSGAGTSVVDGAITATSSIQVPVVTLTGGVTLDGQTQATIGTTEATNNYFSNPNHNIPDAELFTGSLLAVIDGPNTVPTAVTGQDRLLGVYDGSKIDMDTDGGNKALLSVLDGRLTGPSSVPLIDIDAAFKDADTANGPGGMPNVTVTSTVVTRSTIPLNGIPLDGALLEASAPLLALTHATMTTESHFADLAGNKAPSIRLDDALVALNASQLLIKGNLLNLNAATATVNGYLFSLNNGSTLTLNNGALFSLNNGSTLNLTANAFGVFGNARGTTPNTLNITNTLCAAGCGNLVNSANTPFMLNGSPLQVAGVTHNVVLPDNFTPFALAKNAPLPHVTVEGALFKVDSTSTLNIKGKSVGKN